MDQSKIWLFKIIRRITQVQAALKSRFFVFYPHPIDTKNMGSILGLHKLCLSKPILTNLEASAISSYFGYQNRTRLHGGFLG